MSTRRIVVLAVALCAVVLSASCTETVPTSTPTTTKRATTQPEPTSQATIAPVATPTKAPPAPTPEPKTKYGGTLKWATNQESVGMDTAGRTSEIYITGTGRATRQIYNGLFQYEPETQELLPELATEWSASPDGKEITIKLRPGVQFHDGTAFNAEAVKFHFERIIGVVDPQKRGSYFSNYTKLTRVDVVDDLTAKFVLKSPQASLINYLGDPSGYITSPTAYKKNPDAFSRNPIGTGPMIMKEWINDTRIVLEKNPDYWEKDPQGNKYPYLDSIIMTPINDTTVQIANVRAGTMDYAEEIPPQDVALVKTDPNLVYYESESFGAEVIGLRQNKPPFDNQACREAFFGAIDRKAMAASVYRGVSKPAETLISPVSPYYDPATKGIPFDLDRVKTKLEECGKPDGFEVDILVTGIPRVVNMMVAVQAMEAKAGIKVNNIVLLPTSLASEYARQKKGNGWGLRQPSYSDPLGVFRNFQCDNPGNFQGICSPELERLFDEAESAMDFDKRKAALQEVAKFAAHTPWNWTVVFNPENAVALKKVKGLRPAPQFLQQFKWVWLE